MIQHHMHRAAPTFPAINIPASGTRREEMLLSPEVMRQVILLRKMLSAVGQIEGTELLLQRLGKTKTNKEFLSSIAKAMEADAKNERADSRARKGATGRWKDRRR